MKESTPVRLLLPLALLFALAPVAAAQAPATTAQAQAPVDVRRALSALPDSQAVLFVNARRIINEMLPRLLPPAEYQKMLTQAQQVGFDARGVEYAAAAVRLSDPPPANGLPEFLVVVRGNFNADSLLTLGRVMLSAQNMKSRSETYGSKTIEILDMQSLGGAAAGAAAGDGNNEGGDARKPVPYPEVAFAALDSSTLVIGVPAYLRAAVDASGGRGGLRAPMIDLAMRDPQALWSLTAELPPSITDYAHKAGAPANQEFDQMVSWVKQVNLAQGMDALNYSLSAAVLTDAPEHASAFSGLVRMGLLAAQTALSQEAAKLTPKDKDYAKTRAALDALKTFVNRTDGSTLILSVSAPQKVVTELVRQEMANKQAQKAPAQSTPQPGRRGRPRRR